MSSMFARSKGTNWREPVWWRAASLIAELSSSVFVRAMATTWYPTSVSLRAIPRPNPRLPPVTITLRMVTCHLTRGIDGQNGNEVERYRNLVPRQGVAAEPQDLVLQRLILAFHNSPVRCVCISMQHHIGDDKRARNGTSARPDTRHAYRRVLVQHSLDLLRVDFQSSDIDDPAPAAQEVVAIAASFHDVARINEPPGVHEWRAFLADIAGRG